MGSGPGLAAMADKFRDRRVLVLGDVITDIYLEGRIARISREAPVFVLEHLGETMVLGGAGNAAANIQSLGGRVILAGVLGDDEPGRITRDLARNRGIDVSLLALEPGRPSCTKTRILAAGEHTVRQQMLRVDRARSGLPARATLDFLRRGLERAIPNVEAVVLSDYGLGILPLDLLRLAMDLAVSTGLPVVADSRYQILSFQGATVLTPNVAEAEAAVGGVLTDEEAVIRAGRILMARLRPKGLLITRGPEGMSLFEADGRITHIPAANRLEVFDVSGAGDTVVAGVALGMAAGLDLLSAARLANFAAGVVVRKMGTATVGLAELKEAIGQFASAGP